MAGELVLSNPTFASFDTLPIVGINNVYVTKYNASVTDEFINVFGAWLKKTKVKRVELRYPNVYQYRNELQKIFKYLPYTMESIRFRFSFTVYQCDLSLDRHFQKYVTRAKAMLAMNSSDQVLLPHDIGVTAKIVKYVERLESAEKELKSRERIRPLIALLQQLRAKGDIRQVDGDDIDFRYNDPIGRHYVGETEQIYQDWLIQQDAENVANAADAAAANMDVEFG